MTVCWVVAFGDEAKPVRIDGMSFCMHNHIARASLRCNYPGDVSVLMLRSKTS